MALQTEMGVIVKEHLWGGKLVIYILDKCVW